jgi:hypothetical protein
MNCPITLVSYPDILGTWKDPVISLWLLSHIQKKKEKRKRVKDIFDTCSLKTLFFGTAVSFRFTNGTWVLQKKLTWNLRLFFRSIGLSRDSRVNQGHNIKINKIK